MTLDEVLTGLRNGTLTSIDLYDKNIRVEGVIAIAEALKENTSVTKLYLGNNNIGVKGAQAIAKALEVNTSVTELFLGHIIGDKRAKAIVEALKKNTSVTTLSLGSDKIGDEGVKAIAEALKENTSVTTLHLSSGAIGAEGAKAIAEALRKNTSVTTLNLSSSAIGDEGAKAIAEALKENTSVTTLYLGRNIRAEGARTLAEALKVNTSVTTLSLGNIGAEGAKAIADALKNNTTVTELVLACHQIDQQIKTDINNLLNRNRQIKTIKDSLLKGGKIEREEGDQCLINNTTYDNKVVALAIKDMVKDLEPSAKDSDSEKNRKGDVTNGLKNVNKSNHLYALVRTLNSLDNSGNKIFSDTEKGIFIEEFVKSDQVKESIKSISLILNSSKKSFLGSNTSATQIFALPSEIKTKILLNILPPKLAAMFTGEENVKKFDSFLMTFIPKGIGKMDIGYITHPVDRPDPTVNPYSNAARLTSGRGVGMKPC